jgi:hypothetical protein
LPFDFNESPDEQYAAAAEALVEFARVRPALVLSQIP